MPTGRIIVNMVIVIVAVTLLISLGVRFWTSKKAAGPDAAALAPQEAKREVLKNFADVSSLMPPEKLKKLLGDRRQSIRIVDIQTRNEFLQAHVSQSINIPSDELEVRAEDELSTSDLLVIVGNSCDGADEESRFRRSLLMSRGFNKIAVLAGGLPGWKAAGFPVTAGRE
jgi:rhodanese-related sulfurtransferase